MNVRWLQWSAAIVLGMCLGAGFLAAGIPSAVAQFVAGTSPTGDTLYADWRQQMETVAYWTQSPYPATKLERMRLVSVVRAANARANGMASLVTSLSSNSQDTDAQLGGGCMSVNGALDEMLDLISTGYNGHGSSQANPRDLKFVHRMIVRYILHPLPSKLVGAGAENGVARQLNLAAADLQALVGQHFARHVAKTYSAGPGT